MAAFFGYRAWEAATADLPTPPITPVSRRSAAPQRVERPIEEIRVGERVHVEAGYGDEDYSLGAEVDPATWRKLTLRVPKPDGGHVDVELLRPLAWMDAHGAEAGYTFEISLHEMGVEGPAYVVNIAACPPVRDGPGRVVTGTFHHSSAEILDLSIEGTEPIGTTANHPFWSEDRQEFIRADALIPGERVRTLDGTPRVTSIVPRASPQPVYNLEVQVDHVYHVGSAGTLVHNMCGPKAKIQLRKTNSAGQPINERGQFTSGAGGDSVAAARGRQVHKRFEEMVKSKPGWKSKPRIKDADGNVHIPDAVDPKGRPVELKSRTPSGIKQGRRQLKRYEELLRKKGRVIYYDP